MAASYLFCQTKYTLLVMKAVKVHELNGPEALKFEEAEKPSPKKGEVLIEVYASSVNPVDIKSIQSEQYQSSSDLPVIPGYDVAGIVNAVGEGINNIQAGMKVYGQASTLREGSGALAEYAVTKEDNIALMPDNITFTEAASVPLAACSAYQAIAGHMRLQRGQKILIHGGSGGIGSFAIQLAKHFGGYVITTASGDGLRFSKELGADEVIDYKSEAFHKKIKNIDVVLDTVGGDTYSKSFLVLKAGGMIVSMLEKPDESLMNQYGVKAVLEYTKVNRKTLTEITRLIEEGILKPYIAKTYSLEEAKSAYQAKEKEKILGKIAIEVKS